MSFGFSVGDFIAVGTLAWNLHRKCYLVARDAPEEFKQLVKELNTLSSAIQILEEEVKDLDSTLMSAGEERIRMVKEMMSRIEETLKKLELFSKKYDKLLDKKRPNWKRYVDQFKYSLDASELDALRSKCVQTFSRPARDLYLCNFPSSSLQRLQCTAQKIESEVSEIKVFLQRSETGNLSLPVVSNTVGPHDDTSFKLLLTQILMERAELSQKWSEIGIHDWIRVGNWWYMKDFHSSPATVPKEGYIYLIKASWILVDIVVRHPQLNYLDSKKIRQEFERIERSALQIPGIEAVDSEYMTIWEGTSIDHGLHLRSRAEDQGWIATHENVYFQKYGLNPNCHGTDNRTLLQWASSKGQLDIVDTLLKSQEVLGFDMVPALHAAISGGHQELVERLLNAGANVNAIVGKGRTALQFAALEGHRGIVETLLKSGANDNLVSPFDETALELAVNGNHGQNQTNCENTCVAG
ncbi:hypothetical protein K440DRAFT_604272 [Wilcoxina mikolae CBS 423.85]|nr:hypothetical protein K440DRAFT_604272 [Wilcoxina mikolae CBS 423.85]